MKVDIAEEGIIRLKEVFNPVLFETEEGEALLVCMRDGGFEVGLFSKERKTIKWCSIQDTQIRLLN